MTKPFAYVATSKNSARPILWVSKNGVYPSNGPLHNGNDGEKQEKPTNPNAVT